MRLVLSLPVVMLALLLLAAAPSAPTPAETTTQADTLRYELTAGDALVVPLPGSENASFRMLHAPALTVIVGRSFGFRSLPGQSGRQEIHVERRDGSRTDTLVLVVNVR